MYIFMFIFIYICCADAVKIFQYENFKFFFKFTFKIQAFSSKLLSRFRQFRPCYFQDQVPRSSIFFEVTSKIRYFLASSCKTRHCLARSSKRPARIMHCLPRSWKWNLTDSCRKCMSSTVVENAL